MRPIPLPQQGWCDWNSPDNENVTTAKQAQHLADMDFALSLTNPTVIKSRKDHKETLFLPWLCTGAKPKTLGRLLPVTKA